MPAKPAYLRVIDEITEAVAAGVWKPGEQLPKVADLAHEFRVTLGTMRRAIMILEDRGVLEGRQGKGVFVPSVDRQSD